ELLETPINRSIASRCCSLNSSLRCSVEQYLAPVKARNTGILFSHQEQVMKDRVRRPPYLNNGKKEPEQYQSVPLQLWRQGTTIRGKFYSFRQRTQSAVTASTICLAA